MDHISYVETARDRCALRALGLTLANSHSTLAPGDVVELTRQVFCGQAGEKVLQEFSKLLVAGPGEECWLPPTGFRTHATFQDTAVLVMITLRESWKRLVLVRQRCPSSMFKLVSMSVADGQAYMGQLELDARKCSDCVHQPFCGQLLRFYVEHGRSPEALKLIQSVLSDVLLMAPTTSQAVEKYHANVQVGHNTWRNAGLSPATVQRESYIMSCRLRHSRVKNLLEQQLLGDKRVSAKRMMGHRKRSSSSVTDTSVRDKYKALRQPGSVLDNAPKRQSLTKNVLGVRCGEGQRLARGKRS